MLLPENRVILDKIWSGFRPATTLKPLAVLDFVNSLLFIKQLDRAQAEKERISGQTNRPVDHPIYTVDQQDLRWSSFEQLDQQGLYEVFTRKNGVLDFAKGISEYSRIGKFDKEEKMLIPPSDVLAETISLINQLQVTDNTTRTEMINYLVEKSKGRKIILQQDLPPTQYDKIQEPKGGKVTPVQDLPVMPAQPEKTQDVNTDKIIPAQDLPPASMQNKKAQDVKPEKVNPKQDLPPIQDQKAQDVKPDKINPTQDLPPIPIQPEKAQGIKSGKVNPQQDLPPILIQQEKTQDIKPEKVNPQQDLPPIPIQPEKARGIKSDKVNPQQDLSSTPIQQEKTQDVKPNEVDAQQDLPPIPIQPEKAQGIKSDKVNPQQDLSSSPIQQEKTQDVKPNKVNAQQDLPPIPIEPENAQGIKSDKVNQDLPPIQHEKTQDENPGKVNPQQDLSPTPIQQKKAQDIKPDKVNPQQDLPPIQHEKTQDVKPGKVNAQQDLPPIPIQQEKTQPLVPDKVNQEQELPPSQQKNKQDVQPEKVNPKQNLPPAEHKRVYVSKPHTVTQQVLPVVEHEDVDIAEPPPARSTRKFRLSNSFYKMLMFLFVAAFAVTLLYFSFKKPTRTSSGISTPGLANNSKIGDSVPTSPSVNQEAERNNAVEEPPVQTSGDESRATDSILALDEPGNKGVTASTPEEEEPQAKAKPQTAPIKEAAEEKEGENAPTEEIKGRVIPVGDARENTDPNDLGREVKGRYKIAGKAYFHDEPDESTRREAFVIHWNNSYTTLQALDETTNFIYVEFRNHKNQVSKGWLRKRDLIPLE